MPRYDIITFDCYGTLIDWESGIAGAFAGVLTTRAGPDREEILRAYAALEPVVEHEGYRTYREVLRDTAVRVLAQFGLTASHSDADFLSESLARWKPFPDTNAALERLVAAGCCLGILSNVDDDLLAVTRKHFTAPFDLVITAQQVRSYKPAAGHFIAAGERIGSQRWLHAAQSNYHDIVPANSFGVPNAWINRKHERALPGGAPTFEFSDLAGLADAMA